jgi:hypothetical protein
MENFNLRHWWNLLGVAGAAIAVASVQLEPGLLTGPGLLIGLGLLSLGVGEWKNHQRTEITRGDVVGSYMTTRSNPWKPKPLGLVLDVIGVGLVCFGLYRVILTVPSAP